MSYPWECLACTLIIIFAAKEKMFQVMQSIKDNIGFKIPSIVTKICKIKTMNRQYTEGKTILNKLFTFGKDCIEALINIYL